MAEVVSYCYLYPTCNILKYILYHKATIYYIIIIIINVYNIIILNTCIYYQIVFIALSSKVNVCHAHTP